MRDEHERARRRPYRPLPYAEGKFPLEDIEGFLSCGVDVKDAHKGGRDRVFNQGVLLFGRCVGPGEPPPTAAGLGVRNAHHMLHRKRSKPLG